MRHLAICLLSCLLSATPLAASEPEPAEEPAREIASSGIEETVLVTGDPEEPTEGVPGSAAIIPAEELLRRRPMGIAEALRGVPGVSLRSEDSTGFLPNIGVRGLNPDRSEKLLILEDGLPASLAPYNENAAYYAPPIERMERVELLKGSGSILHGPQTVGGVLNYVTRRPPETPSGSLTALLGTDGYGLGHVQYGGMQGRVGWDISGLHKRGDGMQDDSGFSMSNLTGKLLFEPTPTSELILKLNWQEHEAETTYLGLTRGMFADDPSQKTVRDDVLRVHWNDVSAVFRKRWTRAEFSVAAYRVSASRDWNRQDFARNTGFAAAPSNTVATLGDTSLDGGAIYLRSSYGSRDRDFDYWGLEPRLMLAWGEGRLAHRTWLGVRFHFEDMIDARNNSDSLDAPKRTRTRELREVDARAVFVQHEFLIAEKLSIIPGIRYEDYDQRREFLVKEYADSDDQGGSSNGEIIPGLGLSYRANEAHEIFFGIHRGYAPPRTADAIASDGADLELEAERSWNWELGWRARPIDSVTLEATAFMLDFENQVVPANESGGASTTNTNAGETRHQGLEFAGTFDLLNAGRRASESRLLLSAGATFLDTENVTKSGIHRGKELPYAPDLVARAGLDWIGRRGFEAGFEIQHAAEQFADQANTVEANEAGTVGLIPSVTLCNLRLRHRLGRSGAEIFLNANNLLDRRYLSSRAPEGSFPGAFRQVMAGLRWEF